MDKQKRLVKCFEDNGIEISENGVFDNIDSLRLISTIVNIEQEFGIEIPDEWFLYKELNNIKDFESIVLDY